MTEWPTDSLGTEAAGLLRGYLTRYLAALDAGDDGLVTTLRVRAWRNDHDWLDVPRESMDAIHACLDRAAEALGGPRPDEQGARSALTEAWEFLPPT